jgi:hypothetical protein
MTTLLLGAGHVLITFLVALVVAALLIAAITRRRGGAGSGTA